MFDLVRRRKTVLKLAQRAGQVYEQSAGLQRSAQERALLAKVAANPLRAGSLGSSSVDDIALLVALDRVNQTRSILNVSTNELDSLIRKTRPHVGFLGSHVRFVRNLLSAEKRKKLGIEIAQAEGGLEIAQRLIDSRLHRMGQSRTVNVHRILAANTIEEHLVNLIEKKTNLFMAYANESAIKDSSQMASDPSTGVLERELVRLLEEEQ